ncbi:MAG: tRNA uridine-5-carboxymethylaminomethyl(34) synthesis enzyme MnmG [Tsuneonella sp.]
MLDFDIIVVGGGHAGVEAAAVSARMGARVALVTFDRNTVGAMSCNPAIGGLGKGHLVREVDAFDGIIGRAADAAAIHYRMLNRSKGSAVWGPRIQADRSLFRSAVQSILRHQGDLTVLEGEAASLEMTHGRIVGLALADGSRLSARAVILCTGTFLGGRLFRGEERLEGGRIGENAAHRLATQLREADLPIARLKTGTPPRLDGRTIDWAALNEQPSDPDAWTMSPLSNGRLNPQLACAVTRTNQRTHDVIRASLDRSPLFSGAIGAAGPRYCPSIEDKIHRFGDRDGHQVFLEPEGLDTHLVYPNGISTSLPADVQVDMVRSMEGLSQVEIVVPGYAVEYDHIDPRALDRWLQVRSIPGLYCAGQINGTTGYEEAAAQGLIAGLGASTELVDRAPIELERSNSYMAVMVDDLTLHGVSEPYRMLTSRAEYRLRLRASNATTRLTPLAIEAGCVSDERENWYMSRNDRRSTWNATLDTTISGKILSDRGIEVRRDAAPKQLREWLTHDIDPVSLKAWLPDGFLEDDIGIELVEDAAYAPYVDRQESELRELRAAGGLHIPQGSDFAAIPGLSSEMIERLQAACPETLGAAQRIRGITPAALAAVMIHVKRVEATV